jgi:DNA-binding Lrp family transcriptional regulator
MARAGDLRVALRSTTREATQAFEQKIRQLPEVLQCHCVAGDTDFVLVICARSCLSTRFLRSNSSARPWN